MITEHGWEPMTDKEALAIEPFTGEIHVELESNHKSIAEGWED